jgi:hypothetical protein
VREYPQAEPPGPVTCGVYFCAALLLLAGVIFILAKAGGLI